MYSNNHEYFENIYHGKSSKKNDNENKLIKKSSNYITRVVKRGTYDGLRSLEDYYIDRSNDASKLIKNNNNSYIRHNNTTFIDNINNNKQNYKNRLNTIQPEYNINRNDVMRINTITYFSERDDTNKGRSISSTTIKQNLQNTHLGGNNIRNMNRVELDNNTRNNGNQYLINTNKNTSLKIINKTKSNYLNLNTTDGSKQKMIINDRRKKNNEIYISGNNNNLNNNNYDSDVKEYNKYNQYSTKLAYTNRPIKMNTFEISYESDKGERYSYNNFQKNISNINNNKYNTNYSYNYKYNNASNINLDEKDKNNNINDDNEFNYHYYNKSSYNNQRGYQYKNKILHNNSFTNNFIHNPSKSPININDSLEINNKSVAFVSGRRNNGKTNTSSIKSRQLKQNNSNISKNKENKITISNSTRNNKSIDIININNNNNYINTRNNAMNNVSIETPMTSPNIINKRNINNSLRKKTNNNTSEIIKGNNDKIKFRNYYRKSDIKKIILIQSVFRAFLLKLQLNKTLQINSFFKEFFFLLYNIILLRKQNYWRFFLDKLSKGSDVRLVNKKKIRKSMSKNNKNANVLLNTNNKVILKTKEILHKELGDSFNIINNNNNLKIKLEDMIKENNELKNQILDNKNIEEKLKQLEIENKKNQNINAIIMKDNQQLAKRLKNIQDNRNNQLVIQNQKSIDLLMEDNVQFQPLIKFKHLYLKCLVFKTIMKNRNIIKSFFNEYKNNVKKMKTYKIENNNIFINNKKKINIQMTKNFNINFISQKDNNKHFQLNKIFLKKEKEKLKIISKYFYKFLYLTNYMKLVEEEEKRKEEKEKEIIENKNEQKRNILQSIIDKYERNSNFICKKACKEWRLRSVIFKIKGIAKEIKKKKKLKKKLRDKIAKATLNNLKNKTAQFQSAHEFSYKIDKIEQDEDLLKPEENNSSSKNEDNKKKEENNVIKEEDVKKENNENNVDEYSEESFGLDE